MTKSDEDTYFLIPMSKTITDTSPDNPDISKFKGISWLVYEESLVSPPNVKYPIFQIMCHVSQIEIFESGTHKERLRLIKELLLKNLTNILRQDSPEYLISLANDTPTIFSFINNHLVCFLFNYLTNPNSYATCPYCKTLLTNGNKYCSRKHMESYIKNTPQGKLANMVNKWTQRGLITPTQYTKFVEEGNKLLEKYPYEKVKALMQAMKQKEGV
jgi:hypothetical protein